MTIRLHDTLTTETRPLDPLVPGRVGVYSCGPTVYGPAHIGNFRSFLFADILVRHLRRRGLAVTWVMNITDIDDKIIKGAKAADQTIGELTDHWLTVFRADADRLRMTRPDVQPRATEHIPEIVALIETLLERGHAYRTDDGSIFFRIASWPAYGRLAKLDPEQMRIGERVEADEYAKDDVRDFALWKAAKPGEPAWDSPWGKGRPGWHIECSAMTVTHLGETFDIHAGGKDLIFPHHENEIAQSQGADGEGTFARYWLHNGFLNFEGVKMSKSLGNVFNCDQIAEAVGGEALRYFCVKHHYRSPVDFDVQIIDGGVRFFSLEGADRELAKFNSTLAKLDAFVAGNDGGAGAVVPEAEKLVPDAREALADDFNAPVVIASLHAALGLANRLLDEGKGIDKQMRRRTLARLAKDIRTVGAAIGVFTQVPADYLRERKQRLVKQKNVDVSGIEQAIKDRAQARANKDFAAADAIRKGLLEKGVELHDTPSGTDWSVQD
jgi:cysteinyl-tRNA synthetase